MSMWFSADWVIGFKMGVYVSFIVLMVGLMIFLIGMEFGIEQTRKKAKAL